MDPPDGGNHDCLSDDDRKRPINPRDTGYIRVIPARRGRMRSSGRKKRMYPNGTKLAGIHRGRLYCAKVVDGEVVYNGKRFSSLSAAAEEVTGKSTNGWTFWKELD